MTILYVLLILLVAVLCSTTIFLYNYSLEDMVSPGNGSIVLYIYSEVCHIKISETFDVDPCLTIWN